MGKNISHLKIGSETYDLRPYAVCSSSAYDEEKIVECPGFTIHDGAEITVLFDNGNLFWDSIYLLVENGDGTSNHSAYIAIDGWEYHGGIIFPPRTTHTLRYSSTNGTFNIISYNGLYPTINCTYNDLCSFVSEEMLIPGQTYQIDYNPTIYSDDVEYYGDFNPSHTSIRSGLTPCSLVLTATSGYQFDEKVNVVDVSTDIKKNTNTNWDVWYSLFPTRNASWAGNRTIYVYDVDGETYDFCDAVYVWFNNNKYYIGHTVNSDNVIYMKYGISNYYGASLYFFNGTSMAEYSTVDEYHEEYYSFYGVITRLIDEYDNDLPYDFKNIYFKGYNLFSDATFVTNKYYPTFTVTGTLIPFGLDASVSGHAHCNKMERCYRNGYAILNQNMFIKRISYNDYHYNYICNNTFGCGCYKNLFNGPSKGISFGNDCYENKLSSGCQEISFGNNCYQNTIGDSVTNCSFGNGCYGNTIGNSSSYNSFGNYCYQNSVDYSSTANSFGNQCYSNTIGNTSTGNSFGNRCNSNNLGYSSSYNSFGNGCEYNKIGNYCDYNTFGNYCRYNSFRISKSSTATLRNYCNGNIFDPYVQNVIIYNTSTASGSYVVRNIHVYAGYVPTSTTTYRYASVSYNLATKYIVRNSADTTGTLQS